MVSTFSTFFFSSLNLGVHYRHVWQLTDGFSVALKATLATNLYSDWDQFRRYAWLGVGAELGFGKVKSGKKNKGMSLEK